MFVKNHGKVHTLSRRKMLKAGVGSLVAGSVSNSLLYTSDASAAPVALPCVRSPWANYSLNVDSVTTLEAFDSGNEALISLQTLSNDPLQWSENPGWWTGNGSDRALEADWILGKDGFDTVLIINESAILLGIEILKPVRNFSEEVVYRLGKTVPGVLRHGIELKINGAGKPQITVWDDAGVSQSIAGKQVVSEVNGGHTCIFVYIDKRDTGSQTMALYQYEAGSIVQSNRVKDISFLGPLSGGVADSAKKVQVGVRRNAAGNFGQFYNGQIRGFHAINFGATPPAYVNDIMDALSVSGMQPEMILDGA